MLESINLVKYGPDKAEAVILIHPIGCDLTFWEAEMDNLRHAYQVVAFDLPGHGKSKFDPDQFTFDSMAALVKDLVDLTGKSAAHIVGISVGGMIAQAFALKYPTATLSLSLIATASSFPDAARENMRQRAHEIREHGVDHFTQTTMQRWFTQATVTGKPDIVERASKIFLSTSAPAQAAMWEMIARFDSSARLHEIACPTLLIAGEEDMGTPPSTLESIRNKIPHAHFIVIPAASHMVTLEQPIVTNSAIGSFLDGLRPVA